MAKEKSQVEDEQGRKMFSCEVECRFPILVLAKDAEEAKIVAVENAEEEYSNLWNRFNVGAVHRILGKKSVPDGWLGGLPYYIEGEAPEEETNVNEIINEWNKRKGGE